MSLALALGWKYSNAPGLRTRELPDGSFEIFDWPAGLGAQPDPAAVIAEWEAAGKPGGPAAVVTYEAFRARFTAQELAAVKAATLASADALDWALMASARNSVDLTGANVSAFLDAMIGAGALTAQRKAEILAH